jgi:hypothetical protein
MGVPASTEEPKPSPKKTLVVGSSGHAHVTCVTWPDLKSVNVKDFDAIVLNVASLDDKTIIGLPQRGFFNEIRKELSRLLGSGGKIVVLTPARRTINQKDDWRNNWEWSPFEIGIQPEAGDTIEIKHAAFPRYFSKFNRWSFYFFIPEAALSNELTQVFGSPTRVKYDLPVNTYAINRYGKMLAGEVRLTITSRIENTTSHQLGSIIVIPFIPELEQKEAINLILEDLIGKAQRSLPPEWLDQIAMPFVDSIDAAIVKKKAAIELLRREIVAGEQQRGEIEKWKKLVYTTGHELEQIFEEAIIRLGAKTRPANAEEEFIFEHRGSAGVVECKGVGKSISLEHVRQADSHVLKFIQAESRDGKGVLLGNAWRNLPVSERGRTDTPVFPDNVVKHAAQREIALVGAYDFLEVFCRFLRDEISAEAILDAMMMQSGIVDFRGAK